MDSESILAIAFAALLIVFVTLGCVLLLFFFAARFPTGTRAVFASGLGAVVLLGPVMAISGMEGDDWAVFFGLMVLTAAIGFPVAFLATRKLDRRKNDIAGIFD